jgi:hypothetical protein
VAAAGLALELVLLAELELRGKDTLEVTQMVHQLRTVAVVGVAQVQ